MPNNRTLFDPKYVEDFTEWMVARGYVQQLPTNEYEKLRFMKLDSSFEVVNYYLKKNSYYYTIQGKGAELFLRFLKEITHV